MKRIEKYIKYIIKDWILITIGLILTKIAVVKCYEQRGGFYIGGEWFILPVMFLVVNLIPAVIRDILEIFREEDEDFAGEAMEICQRMERQRSRHIR